MTRHNYPAWQRRHEAVLQYLLERPGACYREISRVTGYSETHLSRIVNAPEFYRRYRAHRQAALQEAARRMLFGWRQKT
jgi:AraC-like DNA-binding protein